MPRIKDVAIGFGAGAVLLTSALFPYFSHRIEQYSRRADLADVQKEEVVAAKQDLERRLRVAEEEKSLLKQQNSRLKQETSRFEQHNNRLRDELILTDVKLKRLSDRLQSSRGSQTSSTTAVRRYEPKTDRTKPDTREPARPVDLDSLIEDMRKAAYANYERLKQNLKPKYSRQLKAEFVSISQRHGVPAARWEELQEFFERRGKYAFVANARNEKGLYAEVMLAEIVSKKNQTVTVSGRDFPYTAIVIRDFTIKEFASYDSNGKHANVSSVIRRTIIHNWNVLRASATTAWRSLSGKYSNRTVNKFRQNIIEAEWRELYNNCIRKNSSRKDAEKEFVERACELYAQDGVMNEVYHMSVKGTKYDTSDNDENIRSVYFNYLHSPLEQGAFHTEAYQLFNLPENSRGYQVSKTVFSEFVGYIRAQQRKGKFRNIRIKGDDIKEQVQNLYLLTGSEIKEIARYLLERKVERFR